MLELESLLDKERQKLGRLRKAHYQIAAELGLIEEVSYFYHCFNVSVLRNIFAYYHT